MGWLGLEQLRLALGRPGGEGAAHQIAVSCGCLCLALSASAPFPSTSFLLAEFHQPFLSSSFLSFFLSFSLCFAVQGCLSLCPCCVLSCWEPIIACLPGWDSSCKWAEGQKHHQPGTPSCNSCSATEHACVS